jgi:hypothetical protein
MFRLNLAILKASKNARYEYELNLAIFKKYWQIDYIKDFKRCEI